MLFYLVGKGTYQHDAANVILTFLYGIPAAALFGAPLAVPVAIFVPLRNVWSGVPLIAIVAGIGAAAQFQMNGLLADANANSTLQLFLMMVYVIPAMFGLAAVFLLRWQTKLAVAAVPLAIFAVIILWVAGGRQARTAASAHSVAQRWSVLRMGMPVYTGGFERGQSICATLEAYFDSEKTQQPCSTVANATPAIVEEIFPCKSSDPDWGWESPAVRIRARDGSWRGFTDSSELQPTVPAGTVLDMERDWGAPLDIVDERDVSKAIGASASVRLLRYDPKRNYSLYVEILDGDYRGLRGWMGIQAVDTGGVALGEYSLQYPDEACERP